MRSVLRISAVGFAFLGSAAIAAEPVPKMMPPPSWVKVPTVPGPNAQKASAPFQFLITSSQERILRDSVENYVEYVAVPQNAAGLQALGNIVIPWNISRANLTIHKISIRRDGKAIDLLKPSEILVLRRENNLERAVLDGVRTVVVPAKGLQIGDELDVAFTYTSKVSALARKPEEAQPFRVKVPVGSLERRFLVPDDVSVQWKIAASVPKPVVTKAAGVTEYLFSVKDPPVMDPPKFAPDRYTTPLIQVSGYASWSDISDELLPGFNKARQLQANSPLIAEAEKIGASTQDPSARMLAALRLVQDRVRYVALLLGDGAYVPSSADETWERKFGDCKGKTALLLALLDKLGISAEPMLVSTAFDDAIGGQLPSLFLFDHVLVRANLSGKSYYLDATDYGQRTLEELSMTMFSKGLPLRPSSTLETLVQGQLTAPVREVSLTWDASKEGEEKFPFEAKLTLRGSVAATIRAKLAAATDAPALDTDLKNMVPGVENDDLSIIDKNPEMPDGSMVVNFKGTAAMDWSPYEGKRERRFSFTNGTINWDPDFDREKGPGKDWPVVLASRPYWERLTETVILPNAGKRFTVDATTLEQTVAGSTIKRSASLVGDRAIAVSDFRHLQREITAEEARNAIPKLKDVRSDYAYVVGPPLPKSKKR